MKKYHLKDEIKVFGTVVRTFPDGIDEAFNKLVQLLPNGDMRTFYGIGECKEEGIV